MLWKCNCGRGLCDLEDKCAVYVYLFILWRPLGVGQVDELSLVQDHPLPGERVGNATYAFHDV